MVTTPYTLRGKEGDEQVGSSEGMLEGRNSVKKVEMKIRSDLACQISLSVIQLLNYIFSHEFLLFKVKQNSKYKNVNLS